MKDKEYLLRIESIYESDLSFSKKKESVAVDEEGFEDDSDSSWDDSTPLNVKRMLRIKVKELKKTNNVST